MPTPEAAFDPGPSFRIKFAFGLLLGMLSTAFAEVVAGSTPFPFLDPWGILVVTPLYTLHILVLAAGLVRFRMLSWQGLCFAGALFGLYEAYITKVLFDPPWGQEIALTFAGVAWGHVVLLALFWHALLAFIVPLLLGEVLLTRSRRVFGVLPERVRSALVEGRRPWYWTMAVAVACGLTTSGNATSIPKTAMAIVYNGVFIALLIWLWRSRAGGTRYTLEQLLPGRRGLAVLGVLLGLFYVATGLTLRRESLPGPAGHVAMALLYVLLGAALLRCRTVYREPPMIQEPEPPDAMPWRFLVAFIGMYAVVMVCTRLALGQFAVAFLLVDWAVGGVAALIVFARAAYSLRPVRT